MKKGDDITQRSVSVPALGVVGRTRARGDWDMGGQTSAGPTSPRRPGAGGGGWGNLCRDKGEDSFQPCLGRWAGPEARGAPS